MTVAADFTRTLGEALQEVRDAGLADAAAEAQDKCSAACTTSSEWLGEVGIALTALLAEHGASLPASARAKLRSCLDEVAKVWPKYRSA